MSNKGGMKLVEKIVLLATKSTDYIFDLVSKFPKEARYDIASQIRRSSLSIALNVVEGNRRDSNRVFRNFLAISRGSLHETKYLLYFSFIRGYIDRKEYEKVIDSLEEIGKLLWSLRKKLDCSL